MMYLNDKIQGNNAIWGCHSLVAEIRSFLICYVVSFGK
jgi:hypothetical protein